MPKDQWSLVKFRSSWTDDEIKAYKQDKPFEAGFIKSVDAVTSYERVLFSGGANLPIRDAVDTRIINDVKNSTGNIIKSQDDVGAWPTYNSEPPLTDTDKDGMPDQWEIKQGLNAQDAKDRNRVGENGYTMLETYLNSIQ